MRQILFIQGGGEGAYDDWDIRLVESLRRELGPGYEVRYPRMPAEDDPTYARWKPAIEMELRALRSDAVVVGHSVGGTMLINVLAGQPPGMQLAAVALVAAPFVGEGGWSSDQLATPRDLAAKLPEGAAVHIFHGLDDETAPPDHAELYARVLPEAHIHRLPGRDHQLGDDLSEIASVIRALAR